MHLSFYLLLIWSAVCTAASPPNHLRVTYGYNTQFVRAMESAGGGQMQFQSSLSLVNIALDAANQVWVSSGGTPYTIFRKENDAYINLLQRTIGNHDLLTPFPIPMQHGDLLMIVMKVQPTAADQNAAIPFENGMTMMEWLRKYTRPDLAIITLKCSPRRAFQPQTGAGGQEQQGLIFKSLAQKSLWSNFSLIIESRPFEILIRPIQNNIANHYLTVAMSNLGMAVISAGPQMGILVFRDRQLVHMPFPYIPVFQFKQFYTNLQIGDVVIAFGDWREVNEDRVKAIVQLIHRSSSTDLQRILENDPLTRDYCIAVAIVTPFSPQEKPNVRPLEDTGMQDNEQRFKRMRLA